MNVLIVGSGYVGLTTGTALAYLGHQVTLLDIDKRKIAMLRDGVPPIHERGLAEVLTEAKKNMRLTDNWNDFNPDTEVVIVAVGTPDKGNGDPDLTYVEAAARGLGERIREGTSPVVVNKSTVPLGSARRVKAIVEQDLRERGVSAEVHVASNPEFLREGEALFDTFYPERIVIGVQTEVARNRLYSLYQPILEQSFAPPRVFPRPEGMRLPALISTTPTSAELIKYAANSFLAMKISFINEFAALAEQVGADIEEVAKGIGLDSRIGRRYLNAGIGWGGSCFGKDTAAVLYTGQQYGVEMPLVEATVKVNQRQREWVVRQLQAQLKVIRGQTIGLLGLSFKPNTDDLRDAPSLDIIRRLHELGAQVKVYDPVAMDNCREKFPDLPVRYAGSVEALFDGCQAVVLVTEWEAFRHLPYAELGERMVEKRMIDGRNALEPETLRAAGFIYTGVGRL